VEGEKESQVDIAVFVFGLITGIAAGVLIIGFLAVGAYNRGYDDALFRRKDWRGELVARQAVAARSLQPVSRKAS
jgi:hypothetical protein